MCGDNIAKRICSAIQAEFYRIIKGESLVFRMTHNALYATDVYHYDHVIKAMHMEFSAVDLIRRWEPTPELIATMVRLRLPEKVVALARRRMRRRNPYVRNNRNFLTSSILPAITIHTRRHLIPKQAQLIAKAKASKVRRLSTGYTTIQFVEGLGYKLLKKHPKYITICECRTHHHSRLSEPWDLYLDYPEKHNKYPVPDQIDFEHTESNKILVYSEASRRSFEQSGYSRDKIIVCPLPLQDMAPRVEMPRDSHRIVFVGRSEPYKGLDLAVATVQRLGGPYRLSVAGPMSDEVKKWMKRFPFVDYLGILTKEQLRNLYSSASVYLCPSEESFGLAAADAVYHGCYLICSDWTGISEYMPSARVTTVSGRNVDQWADAVSKWTKNLMLAEYAEIDKVFSDLTEKAVVERLSATYRHLGT